MTLQEINKKISQCTTAKKMIHFQLYTAVKKKDTAKVEKRAKALVETIDELNRLQDLKSQL
tara:strand:+ start:305 stop:487 length:183 start_codon:yes stop_codon:yes gene_type:complete